MKDIKSLNNHFPWLVFNLNKSVQIEIFRDKFEIVLPRK